MISVLLLVLSGYELGRGYFSWFVLYFVLAALLAEDSKP